MYDNFGHNYSHIETVNLCVLRFLVFYAVNEETRLEKVCQVSIASLGYLLAMNAFNAPTSWSRCVLYYRQEYDQAPDHGVDADVDDDDVFGASATANNPFASGGDELDVGPGDQDASSIGDPGGGDGAMPAFNPFATISDEDAIISSSDQVLSQQPGEKSTPADEDEIFDPFQTIHDDDALNVPFSSTEEHTDDLGSPSRCLDSYMCVMNRGGLI